MFEVTNPLNLRTTSIEDGEVLIQETSIVSSVYIKASDGVLTSSGTAGRFVSIYSIIDLTAKYTYRGYNSGTVAALIAYYDAGDVFISYQVAGNANVEFKDIDLVIPNGTLTIKTSYILNDVQEYSLTEPLVRIDGAVEAENVKPVKGGDIFNSLKLKLDTDKLGAETNIIKKANVIITDGERTSNGGYILADANYFRTGLVPVIAGERFATVSSNDGNFPRFTFYNSESATSGAFVSYIAATEATVPVGATYMIFAHLLNLKDSSIVQKLISGFPSLNEETFIYNDIYTKDEVDEKFETLVPDPAMWIPDVFEIDIINTQSAFKVLAITENDTLYGTNGYRDIFKATNVDLSDQISVVQLNSSSKIQKLLFVSATKAVGYVRSTVSADEGFYCFDNANTDAWTARRISKMEIGAPAFEFQSLVKTPDSAYLFATSYHLPKGVAPYPNDIYRSIDLGESWQIVYTHSGTENTHIHAIEWDIYRDRVWCAIGDEGAGGVPGWAYSDDYGGTWFFVENDDASGQIPFMDTAIIPTRKYVLFGSDYEPAGVRKWQPTIDGKNETVLNSEVTNAYLIPVVTTGNFGFAKNPVYDIRVYPYKIAMGFSHNAAYSKAGILLSPNFKDWYFMNFIDDPTTEVSWSSFSGITSDGWVLGWCTLTSDGLQYYIRFKYPNWIKN